MSNEKSKNRKVKATSKVAPRIEGLKRTFQSNKRPIYDEGWLSPWVLNPTLSFHRWRCSLQKKALLLYEKKFVLCFEKESYIRKEKQLTTKSGSQNRIVLIIKTITQVFGLSLLLGIMTYLLKAPRKQPFSSGKLILKELVFNAIFNTCISC